MTSRTSTSNKFAALFLTLTCLASVLSTPRSEAKELTIKTITCHKTETVLGPDRLYVLVHGTDGRLLWQSTPLHEDKKLALRKLNNGEVWDINAKISMDGISGVFISVFDCDQSSPVNTIQLEQLLSKSLADSTEKEGDILAAGIPARAIIEAFKVALKAAVAASIVSDPDDLLLMLSVPKDHVGDLSLERFESGTRLLGSHSIYSIEVTVSE